MSNNKALKKWAIFGGSFDPLHKAHVLAVGQVHEEMNFDKVFVVPNFQNPILKTSSSAGPTPQQRLEMVQLVFQAKANFEVCDYEITKAGPSYTRDTLEHLIEVSPSEVEFYLILGVDVFEQLHLWKDYLEILNYSHVVLMSRKGHPHSSLSDVAKLEFLKPLISSSSENYLSLKTGKVVSFVTTEGWDLGSTRLRAQLEEGLDVGEDLPPEVAEYIHRHQLYPKGS